MPSWDIHRKWAKRLNINERITDFINKLIDTPEDVLENDPTELGELYRRDPVSMRSLLISHDWGRKGKAKIDILKAYCRIQFGEKGVMAAELHHVLDYIAYVRDPENLARLIISLSIFHNTSGRLLSERIQLIREYYKGKDYREHLKKLTSELMKLDYESYKGIITELVKIKAQEWEIHEEVLEFVMNNLDEILADIDAYLRRKHKRVARPPSTNTLDKWL